MKSLFIRVCVIIPTLLFLQSTYATTFVTSQMIGFATGQLGVVGVAETWAGGSANVLVTNGAGSLDGTGLGLVASAGEKAEINATVGHTTYNLFASSRQIPQPATSTNVYYSFLYRINDASSVSNDTQKIFQVMVQNSGSSQFFEIAAKNVGGLINLGVNKPTATAVYATTNISQGQTVFIVVRQQIINGAGNDIIDLWINPPASSFGVVEASVPTPSASTSSGTESTSNTGPGRYYADSGANSTFDELRITTTWAEATPAAGSCNGAGISSNPTNQTITAGINTRFFTTGTGTTPLYQWQLSTNGGATFSNVSGGSGSNASAYTTPNLQMTDNGTQYRCIVSVTCGGGSSITSSVATVTINPPIITPLGLIVDDFWDDGDRIAGPVATNNSVWRASAGLSATTGAMIGTPVTATSCLWLGYFVDDMSSNVPVHLAVGRTLKTTMVFNISSFNSFTTNGGLRIGLFDYADAGGVRLLVDGGSGSGGLAQNVRGYMLNIDFGTNFLVNTPLPILVRNNMNSVNLLGTLSDFFQIGSGPIGATLSNTPSFQTNTPYTLEFSVSRTATNSTDITAKLTGGSLNLSYTTNDNTYAYHRFDAYAMRPSTLEGTADSFNFTRFRVEVTTNASVAVTPGTPRITGVARSGSTVVVSGTNGTQSGTYWVLTSTNITQARASWTSVATNQFDASGNFIFTNAITAPSQFITIRQLP